MKKVNIILSVLLILALTIAVVLFFKLSKKSDVTEVEQEHEYTEFEKKGGVRIVFEPDVEDFSTVSSADMDTAESIISTRLYDFNPDSVIYRLGETSIVVEIPELEQPDEVLKLIANTSKLEFLNASGEVIMDGTSKYVEGASAKFGPTSEYSGDIHYIQLNFTEEGRERFKVATQKAVEADNGMNIISIVLDGELLMSPTVSEVIDSDSCIITGNYTAEQAQSYADMINSGTLPFILKEGEVTIVSPIVK